jgi:hypothetical protein
MITSAQILGIFPQADGREYVIEQQVDDTTGPELFVYLAPQGTDTNAVMTARTAAINAAINAIPSWTVTMDDGTTATVKTWGLSANLSLQLTTAQKSALQTAKTVIEAVLPLLAVYYSLTPTQQAFVTTHSPWFAQAVTLQQEMAGLSKQ